ncbi:MAG: hypothetical protein DMF60_12410 [Acidobacteria bacterium]|nr:MAG: hypothetical protein DMF60_12410 [Acidobacteriota bacterium]
MMLVILGLQAYRFIVTIMRYITNQIISTIAFQAVGQARARALFAVIFNWNHLVPNAVHLPSWLILQEMALV